MARPKSEPSYLVHSRSGRAYTIIDRRQIVLGKAGTTESMARFDKLRAEWLANGRRLPQATPAASSPASRGPTVAMLLDAFWRHAVAYYARPLLDDAGQPVMGDEGQPRTVETEEVDHFRQVIRIISRMYADTATADFGCPEMEAVRAAMITPRKDPLTGETKRGWSRNHTNHQVSRVRRLFQWGVTKKLVPAIVVVELKMLAGLRKGKTAARETRPARAVPESKALAVVPHVSSQVGAMVRLHLLTGARSTELCIMRPKDIDRSATPWVYRPMFHKTQEYDIVREIRLGPKARAILEPFLAKRDPEAFIFCPAEAEADRRATDRANREYIQPSQILRSKRAAARTHRQKQPGKRYDRTSYYNAIRRGCERAFDMPAEYRPIAADLPSTGDTPEVIEQKRKRRAERARHRCDWHRANGWHPHEARHRSATDLRGAGGLEVAQVQLGHANQRTTQIYADADVAKASKVVEQIG